MAMRGNAEAQKALYEMDGPSGFGGHICSDDRTNVDLVAAVEEGGEKANGGCAILKVVEIPDNIEWEIEEYDGYEHIAEKHRTWG
jgi:hypothetical protein